MKSDEIDIYKKRNKIISFRIIILTVILILCFIISIYIGRFRISITDILKFLAGKEVSKEIRQVISIIRMPRIIAAMIVGASLSVSGAAYQGMFRNPLVSPDILGSSAGAGFGAAIALLLGFNIGIVKLSSLIFGIFSVIFTYTISKKFSKGRENLYILIIAGIIVSNLFQALIGLIKYSADTENKLPAITFWLMGSLAKADMKDLRNLFFPFIISVSAIMFSAGKLNVLSLGSEEARALGVNVKLMQLILIVSATILTAFSVSVSGMVGWVGLVVPHFSRMIVGPDFRKLIPTSMIIGSIYLLIIDDLCRSIFSVEIPLGIMTSLAGLPFFLYLLSRKNN